jgi:hypothetical protein
MSYWFRTAMVKSGHQCKRRKANNIKAQTLEVTSEQDDIKEEPSR